MPPLIIFCMGRFDQKYIPDLIPPENTEHLKKYVRHCELQRNKNNTIKNKVRRIVPFMKWCGQDLAVVQADTIEDFFLERSEKLSPRTLDGDLIEFRVFFKWLLGEEKAKELLKNIHKTRLIRDVPIEMVLTHSDIKKLVMTAGEKQRDRALIMVLWDSAARISEILNLNIGNIQFDRYGAACVINGKTGRRRVRLTVSVPDLQLWMDHHPMRDDPQAPLFVTSKSFSDQGGKPHRLAAKTVETRMQTLKAQAKMHKPCNPHAIRHARLTDLARVGLTEMELRIVGGWSKTSNMPAVYIHLSGADVEKKLLKSAGIDIDDTKAEDEKSIFKPVYCPRCKTLNAHDSRLCRSCGMIIDPLFAAQEEQRKQEEEKDQLGKIAMTMAEDPGFAMNVAQILMSEQNQKQEPKQ